MGIAASLFVLAVAGCTLLLEVPDDPPTVDSPNPDASESVLDASAGDPESPGGQTPPEAGQAASEPNGTASLPPTSILNPDGSPSAPLDAGSSVEDAALPSDAASAPGCVPPENLGPNGHCYLIVATLLPWPDARLSCRSRGDGWDLAAIYDAATNDLLAGLIPSEAWLGGSDADVEGSWRWVIDDAPFWNGDGATGSAVNGAYESWNSDEPNGGGNSDCLRLVATLGAWADLECSMPRASVCERILP